LKNTILASANGAVVGLFIRTVLFGPLVGLCLGFLSYQAYVAFYFFGSKRGDFEYSYKGELIEKKVRFLINNHLGRIARMRYFSDSFNNIGCYQLEAVKKLGKVESVLIDREINYAVQVKTAQLYFKEDEIKKEISYLNAAILLKPYDLLANQCR
jgi:hypothetical protein